MFNFDNTFEIHDDIEVLKRMGMAFGLEKNCCSNEDLKKAIGMMPKALEPYILELAGKGSTLPNSLRESSSTVSSNYSTPSTSQSLLLENKYKNLAQSPLAIPLAMTSQPSSLLEMNASMDQEAALAPRFITTQSSLNSFSRGSPMMDEMYSGADSDSGRSSPLVVS